MAGKWCDRPIDIIVEHTQEGELIPFKIRFVDDDGERVEYKVLEYRNLTPANTDIFLNPRARYIECAINVRDYKRCIKLSYNPFDGIWRIVEE